MHKIDFSKIEDVQDFTPLPDGKYICQLTEIEEATTQYDDEMWKLRFEVIEGKFIGRLVFDNLVFSEAAMKRAKLICSRLGLDVSGELDITPKLLEGRKCVVSVVTEEYEDVEGNTKRRNIIPFAGYDRISDAGSPDASPKKKDDSNEEHLPF